MRFISTLVAGLVLAVPAFAQEQGNNTGTPIGDLFTFGETVVVDYDPMDIEDQIASLLTEACGNSAGEGDDEEMTETPSFSDCTFGKTFSEAVTDNYEERLSALLAVQTRITIARAETEAARHEGILARAIQLRDEARVAAGIAVAPDDLAAALERFEALAEDFGKLSVLVEGDGSEEGDPGMDGELGSLQTQVLELQGIVSEFVNYELTVANWCAVNPGVTLCAALQYQGDSNN